MNKKTLIILITLIIIIGIICGIAFSKNSNKNITTNTQKEENTITNEEINNTTNEIKENEIEENNISDDTQTTATPEETQKTDKEKAIEIIKKDYGTSDNIKFNAEGTDSKGRQIIVVRDIETTAALQFYYVDVSNGTFVKE